MTKITPEGRTTVPLPELTGVEHLWLPVGDITMHVATAGHGTTPVVLLHGFPQHWWEWRELIGPLAEHYRVICPDLRGAGWTEAPPDGFRIERFLDDVLAVLDALHVERAHLVTHDVGSLVAFHLSLRHPERVHSLVAMAIPHPYARFTRAMLRGLPYGAYQVPILVPGLGTSLLSRGHQPLARYIFEHFATPGTWSEDLLEPFLAPLRDPARASTVRKLYRHLIQPEAFHFFGGTYKDDPLLPPTLVLTGEYDLLVQADILAGQHGPAEHLEVREIAGAKHYLVDEQPRQVLDRVTAFLAEHPAAPPQIDSLPKDVP